MSPRRLALLAFFLFVLNVAVNLPLFRRGEYIYRDSIEGGYASMAAFFSEHPNPWGWNPTWYCGLPAQFTYLPATSYATAAAVRVAPFLEPYHAYRMIVSAAACLVPVTFFLLVYFFTRAWRWALLAGLAISVWSPLYDLITIIDKDRGFAYLPWRLQVLVKYGEGPHNAGLMMLPLALIAVRWAARGQGFAPLLTAAALMAAVCLTNWVAALVLAFCGFSLLLTYFDEPGFSIRRVLLAAALAYGLACFWLTPSFIQTTAQNWPVDAYKYRVAETQILLLLGLAAGTLGIRAAFYRLAREQRYFCWVLLGLFQFGWIALWHYEGATQVIPEARRYAVEFEIFLFLALVETLRHLWMRRGWIPRAAVAGIALLALYSAAPQAWRLLTEGRRGRDPMPKEWTIEYKLARKLAELQPQGRVYVTGGMRFRLNQWYPFHQPGGGFESGLRNRRPIDMDYQIRTGMNSKPGEESKDAVEALRALAVEYVVVHGPRSREHYRDVKDPRKFDGLLEEVHREEDDVIYRAPYAWAILARYPELIEWPPGSPLPVYRNWIQAMEDPARPKLKTTWLNPSELVIEGPTPYGYAVSVLVAYDEGWEATQDGQPVRVWPDNFRYLLIESQHSGHARIHLRYRGTREQRVMAAASGGVWIFSLGMLIRERRRRYQS